MKQLALIPLLVLIFAACKKNIEPSTQGNSTANFLVKSSPVFIAKINDQDIIWEPDMSGTQFSSAKSTLTNDPNPSDPARSLTYNLITNRQTSMGAGIVVVTPYYLASSEREFEKIFGRGFKKTGELGKDFFVNVIWEDKGNFSTQGDPSDKIEILKTQEYDGHFGKTLRVWFKINANLKNTFNQNSLLLKDALLLAEYNEYK